MNQQILDIPGKSDVYLRSIELEDVQSLYDLIVDSRQHLKTYQPWAADATLESTTEKIKSNLERIKNGEFLQFRIISRDESKYSGIVGTVSFHNRQEKCPVTLMGYWVSKDAEGKGYAYAGCKRAIEYALNDWGIEHIVLEIDPDNERSEHLAARLGAFDQGVLSQIDGDGQELKSKVWVITK